MASTEQIRAEIEKIFGPDESTGLEFAGPMAEYPADDGREDTDAPAELELHRNRG